MLDLPFTTEEFLGVFRQYNTAIWPAQIVAYVLGIIGSGLAIWRRRYSDALIGLILGVYWVWMGGVYHIMFFSDINTAAYLFGALFIAQGLLFFLAASQQRPTFAFRRDAYGIAGSVLILYAMVIYPLLGAALGHGYPRAPMFGVAPCPATIFTFGLLLWTKPGVPGWLLVIPGIWSVVGFTAALKLGIREDIGLLVAGILAIGMLWFRREVGSQRSDRGLDAQAG